MPKANTRIYRVSVTRAVDGQVSHGFQVVSGTRSVTCHDWPFESDVPREPEKLFGLVASLVLWNQDLERIMLDAVEEGLVYIEDELYSCGRGVREIKRVEEEAEDEQG